MIVSPCRAEGCTALTIGSYCVVHDTPVTRAFVRGRPFHDGRARPTPKDMTGTPSRRPVGSVEGAAVVQVAF